MRKFLLAATIMVPFAAFAGGADLSIAGDGNLAKTTAASTAGVQSTQGNHAEANVGGNGGIVAGAVSGNYPSVATTALGNAVRLVPTPIQRDADQSWRHRGGGLATNQTGHRTPMALTAGRGPPR